MFASDITAIGCAGCTHELFDHSAVRQLDAAEKGVMQETCVTVTWMKLCWQVLCLTGEAEFAARMERSLYNALPGAVNSDCATVNGGLPFDSYSPLLPGLCGRQMGSCKPMENGTYYGCCACIGAAGLGLISMFAAVCEAGGIVLNPYLPGDLRTGTPGGAALTLDVDTTYPVGGDVRIAVHPEKAERFALKLRVPDWSEKTTLRVCGEELVCMPGHYAEFERLWQDGDTVELTLDMRVKPVRPEGYGVSSGEVPYMALRRGLLVLAWDARLGQSVDAPVELVQNDDGSVAAALSEYSPLCCVVAMDVQLADGTTMPVIDYASAGKTWQEDSRMCAWIPMKR